MGSVPSSLDSKKLLENILSYLEYDQVVPMLKPGDLIEIRRYTYKHWAMFHKRVGNTVWCYHISEILTDKGKATVFYEPLDLILKESDGNLSPCRINNQEQTAEDMKTKHGTQSPDINEVFSILHDLRDSSLPYNLRTNNSEHYCTLWKYGIGWSSVEWPKLFNKSK